MKPIKLPKIEKRFVILAVSLAAAMLCFWALRHFGSQEAGGPGIIQKMLGGEPALETAVPEGLELEEEVQRLLVRVYKTARGDFKDYLPSIGVIKSASRVELKFGAEGRIESLNFEEGDVVRKGDLLGKLNPKDARLKLEFNQAKLKTAKTQELGAKKKLDLNKDLYEIGVIIRPKLEEAAIEYEIAKSQTLSSQKEVAFAQSELEKTSLYSPVGGVMGKREAQVGEWIDSNKKIAVAYDISRVYAAIGVTEKDIDRVRLGLEMKVTVDTYPGREFTGRIENISPVVEGKSRTLLVRAGLANPNGELLPGMFTRALIYVFDAKDTIMIPNVALYDLDEDGAFDSIYVISAENAIRIRGVDIGYISTDFVQITRGLRPDELVVVEAQGEIQEGLPVEIIEVQESGF